MKNENIKKLEYIITYLRLGSTKEVIENLQIKSPLNNLSTEDTQKFHTLIYEKTRELISDDVIHNDEYGNEFFHLINEIGCQSTKELLSTKGFSSKDILLNKLSKTQKFFNIPEALEQSITLSLAEEPVDLSITGPF